MRRRKSKTNYKIPLTIIGIVVVAVIGLNVYLQSITPASDTIITPTTAPAVIIDPETGKQKFFTVEEKTLMFQKSPELKGISGYINTDDSISIQKLIDEDNIVLVDFWTYSCINCQRTTPYLVEWHEKYSEDGLVILGVHSPEFAFEKDYNNVVDAVDRFKIEYPVVQDNDFETWKAFNNRYWPRKYIVDIDGFIRYDHIGEGAYDQTELVIQDLLAEKADRLNLEMEMDKDTVRPDDAVEVDYSQIGTPEIYFGYKFLAGRNYLANFNPAGLEKESEYLIPDSINTNFAYLDGNWYMTSDYSELRGDLGRIVIVYSASSVNLVAGGTGEISVFVDGEKVTVSDEGNNVEDGVALVDSNRLYNLVSSESYGTHLLELVVEGDVQAYAFTFG